MFDFIKSYIEREGQPPSYQEIASAFNMVKSNVQRNIVALSERGWITYRPSCPRSIRIIDDLQDPKKYVVDEATKTLVRKTDALIKRARQTMSHHDYKCLVERRYIQQLEKAIIEWKRASR